ncbi:N-acetylmuramoyl-L-alanine amidase [Bacillus toyonensis]|uniref:N-acetylmuramoyl-L-alanine amidase n=1 Tax=Bacillus toyonensis TaxID=155322 RepID=A0A2A8H9N7_9BACI|nr:N-acetylmuramoyl-L-alanine amidase [Bacillus toyonensis]PEP99889.1 N-acetylmuramoyl-L-alanine amidase [Bacillus toyonensis]
MKFSKKGTVGDSIVGKRVIAKMNDLCFYDDPSWQDKDVAGTVDAREGFIIDGRVMVNGFLQYKVYNSKGQAFYITASKKYVRVK